MKERSYTVRVHTHPETWGNENFLASRILASKLLPDAAHVSYPIHSRIHCASSLPARPDECSGSIPRTCTVSRHSAYSFSSDVIKRVICESMSRVVSNSLTREIA
jgi:hypothetical protein